MFFRTGLITNVGPRFCYLRSVIPAGMGCAVSPTAAVIMGDSLMYVVLPVVAVEFGGG